MMRNLNRIVVLTALLGIAQMFICSSVSLAAYPEEPVTLICTWGAGGANDAIARSIAEAMKKYFPQPVVVVNRPGGVGTIGTAEITIAPPDGYTIGTTTISAVTIKPHQMKLPYKTPDDYTPIAMVGTQAYTLMVLSTPFKTLRDFINYAKANPAKVRVGTTGVGGLGSLILEELKSQAKIDLTEVPFKGGGEQIAALLGKHTEATILTLFESVPQVEAGKVRILAVCDERRSVRLPDLPTFKDLGYKITTTTYTFLIGPKALPTDVLSKIQESYKKVSKDANFIKQMKAQGVTVLYEDGEVLKKRLWRDYELGKAYSDRVGLTIK
jgi:tripartite-type tricarboxylate transporter receptor subunit TctC